MIVFEEPERTHSHFSITHANLSVSTMLSEPEASTSADLTPQSLIHKVVINYNTCVLEQEACKANGASHEDYVPGIAAKADRECQGVQQTTIHIPDMFVNFCSLPPALNRHYDSVKQESDTFIRTVSGFNKERAKDMSRQIFHFLEQSLYRTQGPKNFGLYAIGSTGSLILTTPLTKAS